MAAYRKVSKSKTTHVFRREIASAIMDAYRGYKFTPFTSAGTHPLLPSSAQELLTETSAKVEEARNEIIKCYGSRVSDLASGVADTLHPKAMHALLALLSECSLRLDAADAGDIAATILADACKRHDEILAAKFEKRKKEIEVGIEDMHKNVKPRHTKLAHLEASVASAIYGDNELHQIQKERDDLRMHWATHPTVLETWSAGVRKSAIEDAKEIASAGVS